MNKKNSNAGFTLVELMIAVALFTIIVAIAIGGFTNALRTQRQVSSLIATQSNISLALEQMTREIRTGYLFCHDVDVNTPNGKCGTCIISSPPSALTWTCSALDYYTADGTHVNYSMVSGGLIRTVIDDTTGLSTPNSITGDNVNVQKLKFVLFGNLEGDNWNPRITLSIGVSPSSTDIATMNDIIYLQTSVSARQIDCTSISGTLQC